MKQEQVEGKYPHIYVSNRDENELFSEYALERMLCDGE